MPWARSFCPFRGVWGKRGSAPFPSADGRWFRAYGKTGVFKIWVKRASLNYG